MKDISDYLPQPYNSVQVDSILRTFRREPLTRLQHERNYRESLIRIKALKKAWGIES